MAVCWLASRSIVCCPACKGFLFKEMPSCVFCFLLRGVGWLSPAHLQGYQREAAAATNPRRVSGERKFFKQKYLLSSVD